MGSMSKKYDLYNGLPPHEKTSSTSREAAISMLPHAKAIRMKIYRMIDASGDNGLTVDEIEIAGSYIHQTASARVTELLQEGLIANSQRQRNTRQGRKASVWVTSGKEPPEQDQLNLFGDL